ncbi:unnamed protein product [Pseudo-nitzschia multistriata]|uniref:TNase-like domain-containing protein n=1 Tax=Pseudo-nitzschia multistriata TaxID=183589 RepID=A0A448Z5W4_9STRA|nr:unnamed protein product [Pseudo-nitzschia multistriata]
MTNTPMVRPVARHRWWACLVVGLFSSRADGMVLPPQQLPEQPPLSVPAPATLRSNLRDSLVPRPRWTGAILLSLLAEEEQGLAAVAGTDGPGSPSSSTEKTRKTAQKLVLSSPIAPSRHSRLVLSSPITSSTLVAASSSGATSRLPTGEQQQQQQQQQQKPRAPDRDRVERILDANTVQLKKGGTVRLAGVRMPSAGSGSTAGGGFSLPACFGYSPSYKVRQLLPKTTPVEVHTLAGSGSGSNKIPQVVLVRTEDSLVVNEELVKTGFAVVKPGFANQQRESAGSLIDAESLLALQDEARTRGLGIFAACDPGGEAPGSESSGGGFVAEFEPLERTTETVYGDDGGRLRIRDDSGKPLGQPRNPGDVRGCSDFDTYEAALRWYETYEPYYGDVARLDRDHDGVPCPGLPHTENRQQYRMKVPTKSVGIREPAAMREP